MLISNFLIVRILNLFRSLNLYDDDDIDMIRYSLQAILWEIEKIIILTILFGLMNRLDYFMITMVVLLTIRVNAGGFHSKSSLGCLILTFLMFFMAIIVLPLLCLNTIGIYIISGVSLLVTLLLAPIRTIEKEAIQKKSMAGKVISSIITLFWIMMVQLFISEPYSSPVLWMIFLQNVQLLYEYLMRRWNVKCQTGN